MRVLHHKLSLATCAFGAVALTGCAVVAINDAPPPLTADIAPISTSSTLVSARALVPTQTNALTVPDRSRAAPQPTNTYSGLMEFPHEDASRSSTRSPYWAETADYPASYRPNPKIFSPADEARAAATDASRQRKDGFGLDEWSSSQALNLVRGQLAVQRLSYGTLGQESYNAQFTFAAPSAKTGLNFDLGLVPSLSYAQEGDFTVRRVGAEFRLGQDIDQRGNNSGLPGWYFFAGADGEAVIFNNSTAGNGLGLIDGLQLRDQVTVGDIQAGLNLRYGSTNIAFNYIRREVEYELNSEIFERDEDFGGITFTWRR